MIEGGEQLRFALEPRQAVRIEREQLGQHLERDFAIELRVASAVHLAHGARTKRRDDFVGTYRKPEVRTDLVGSSTPGGSERIGEHGLTGDGQPIEEADVRGVRRQQRLDFTTQRVVVTSRSGQKGVALFGPAAPRRPETAPSLAAIARRSRSNFGAELTIEPRFRGAPVALGGRWRHAEHMRRFFDRESAKRTKLHDLGQFRVDLFQAIERVI